MSSSKKHKTLFGKKKKTTNYYGDDGSEPQYTEEQKKRIASYLQENDENCKESTTLILIIVIGLLVALSIVGFLAIRNNSSIKYKGAHTTYEHTSNSSIMDMVWSKWTWLQNLYIGVSDNNTNMTTFTRDTQQIQSIIAIEKELNDFQPIYRNPLLQQLYKYTTNDEECNRVSGGDDNIYTFINIKHGSWIPSVQYLNEAVDFSWADFESQSEKEEIELVQSLNNKDLTAEDKKKKKDLKKQIEKDQKKRKDEAEKDTKKQKNKRLLLNHEKGHFDPLHALPNPANIIDPNSKGDEGQGDIEAEMRKKMKIDPKQFAHGKLPGWLQKKGILGGSPHNFANDLRKRLPFAAKKHIKHLDDIRKGNFGKGVLNSPKDILSQLDLKKYGIKNKITDTTSDIEKENDLKQLEKNEAKRHPYMTLLTNPGAMEDVKCINNDYRKHELTFKKLDKTEAINTITNGFDDDGKKTVFNYDNNVLMWYCYLVTIQQSAVDDILSNTAGQFKVNLTFTNVNMEIGFDYVQIYINSQLIETISGIGLNWEQDINHEQAPSFVYYMDNDYVQRNGNSLEVCMKIITDANIVKDGFNALFTVDFDDPTITKWSDWTECFTKKVRDHGKPKNYKHWNGACGIGVRSKSVTQCMDPVKLNMSVSMSDRAKCNMNETIVEYCVKANCYDFPYAMDIDPQHPGNAFKFNGHGRIDPDFPDPYVVQRSIQEEFNISHIINELAAVRAQIIARYPDERNLGSGVINHYYMDQSKLRLGIRLARSLLLGDTFTAYFTGSSNTAGHENMLLSTYSMQFQAIMRPVWKRIGYKGAAFVVKNHAEGGGLGSMLLAPCIPSLIGDDADVVYWESQMNDHGETVGHAEENHFRNAITLPRRPMYHVMHAGKNGPSHPGQFDEQYESKNGKKAQYKNEGKCYGWVCGKSKDPQHPEFKGGLLMSPYTDFGSGIVMFYPTNGLAGINTTQYEEYRTGYLYISWHPGPPGHRVYAEMIAYHYLTSVLETFMDIKDLIDDLTGSDDGMLSKPIEEMLEILEDPPRTKEIPHDHAAGQCDPFCTNATESVCISGYKTLGKPRYNLKRWRQKQDRNEQTDGWEFKDWFVNPEAFILKEGGLACTDIKSEWYVDKKTTNPSEFEIIFEARQYGYIAIEGDEIKNKVKDNKVEIKIFEVDLKSGELNTVNPQYKQNGQLLQCIVDESKDKEHWLVRQNGCNIGGLKPYQKYQLVIKVNSGAGGVNVKGIRIF